MTVPPGDARRALLALYEAFDADTARIAPVCRASGRCCDFPTFGHTLFASALEAAVLAEQAGAVPAAAGPDLCPWWRDRRCTARAPRPLGCRAFFCDTGTAARMGELHEDYIRRLKALHDEHGLAWDYRPLLSHLARLPGTGA